MPRNRIFGIYVLLGVAALGAGMLVAQFFGTSASLPSGYATPAAVVQATALAAPTAAARPTEAPSSATAAPSPEPASDPPTAAPTPTQALSDPPTATAAPTLAPTLAPTESPTAASDPGYIEYTVQRGDILKDIAQRHGVTIGEILAINQIPNPDSLVVASVIRIPRK